jgi:hypothetical protein
VQWSEALKAWITVGTNGSDISRDDGKTWQPIDNGNWNALSTPLPSRTQCHKDRLSQRASQSPRFLITLPNPPAEHPQK